MKRHRNLWLIGLIVAMLALFTGCEKREASQPVLVALPTDIVSLDVVNTKDLLSEGVDRCIYSTLYKFDENLNIVPCLAEKGERISDLEWVFTLRKGVKFHDGTPLTAQDVKFSVERAAVAEKADTSLSIIKSIEAPDKYTVKVTTKEKCADLESVFVRISTAVMSESAMSKADYNMDKPIGSGPFKLIERIPGKELRLQRNDDYFDTVAKSQYLTFAVQPSEQERTAGLLNGAIDISYRISSYDCDELKLNENVAVYEHSSTKMELMLFNKSYAPLSDIKVRMAIAHAIDRDGLVDNVLDGYGTRLNGVLPAPMIGYIDSDNFTYDPELSRQLLSEAGYPNGITLTVQTYDMLRKKMMEYVKLDLAKVGITINYECTDVTEYSKVVGANEHQCSVMSWSCNPNPDSVLSQLFSNSSSVIVNQSNYSDDRVEALIKKGKIESDSAKRDGIYKEVNTIISDSYYCLPIYQPTILVAARKNLGGVSVNAQGLFAYENLYHIQ